MTKHLVLGMLLVPALAAADAKEYDRVVGTWKGAGKMTMGKDVAKVDAKLDCKRTPGDAGVACTLHVTGVPGLAAYEESDLFGFEPNSGTYHWFSVTNAGETHDHVAKTFGAKTQWTYEGTAEGKPMREVIDMTFGKDGKSIAVKAETFVNNASAAVFEVEVKK